MADNVYIQCFSERAYERIVRRFRLALYDFGESTRKYSVAMHRVWQSLLTIIS